MPEVTKKRVCRVQRAEGKGIYVGDVVEVNTDTSSPSAGNILEQHSQLNDDLPQLCRRNIFPYHFAAAEVILEESQDGRV